MFKRTGFSAALVALMWGSAPSAEAALITGAMSISGGLVPVNGATGALTSLESSTGIDFLVLDGSLPTPGLFGDFQVNSASGDFASLQGSVGSIRDFSFAGAGSFNYPLAPLAGFEIIPGDFVFALSTISIVQQAGALLTLLGTGIFHLPGFENTPGIFVFSANQAVNTFSFSASEASTPIPEPGSMFLVGTGLFGLAAAARRRRAKA